MKVGLAPYVFYLVTSYHLAGHCILARWLVGTWKWLPATHRCKVDLPHVVVSSYWSEYSIAELSVCLGVNNLKKNNTGLLNIKLPLEIKILPWEIFPFHTDVGKAIFLFLLLNDSYLFFWRAFCRLVCMYLYPVHIDLVVFSWLKVNLWVTLEKL